MNKPLVFNSDNALFVDVDETLIFWKHLNKSESGDILESQDILEIPDPYMREAGAIVRAVPHQRHIDLLKRNHGQGRKIIVWSAAGHLWAASVVEALKLEKFVHLIMTKPVVYVDDKPMDQWGVSRLYLSKYLPDHI